MCIDNRKCKFDIYFRINLHVCKCMEKCSVFVPYYVCCPSLFLIFASRERGYVEFPLHCDYQHDIHYNNDNYLYFYYKTKIMSKSGTIAFT